MLCLENVVVQNNNKFYNQCEGIITGDNNSVSIANIALHYVILPISNILNESIIYKRYIDDIIWISQSEGITNNIQSALIKTFSENGLKLLFRRIDNQDPGKSLEFLDVNHCVDLDFPGSFYTTNFIKPTGLNRLFLNGGSYHPPYVFKGIIFCESIRLRRLNERDDMYQNALEQLKDKCIRSGFGKKLVCDMISITRIWKERFSPPKSTSDRKRQQTSKAIWVSCFPNLIQLSQKEKEMNPNTMIVYKRPPPLSQYLTRYKHIAHGSETTEPGSSKPCGRCKLCGNHGKDTKTMISITNTIKSKSGKIFTLKKQLTCSNFGIYAATCTICLEQYVGQTTTSFANRWNGHRAVWKNGTSAEGDAAALRNHYKNNHPTKHNIELAQAFNVTFIDAPNNACNLDMLESRWIKRLDATVNINKTILPKYI